MNPESTDARSLLNLVRQQLILAQVRIMELEDSRDELAPRLVDTEKLLVQAQLLADSKMDEAAHLTRTLANLQAEFQHLQHVQHLTNEALEASREDVARTSARLTALATELIVLSDNHRTTGEALKQTSADLGLIMADRSAKEERIVQLDAELRRMKISRSWRWTRAIRTIERWWTLRRES